MSLSEAAIQHAAITNQLSLYAWAFDWDEIPLIAACYCKDVEVSFMDVGWVKGRDNVVTEMERRRSLYRPKNQFPWHIATNVLVRPSGPDTAIVASWYAFGCKQEGERLSQLTSFGWYDDIFKFEDGDWRILKRRVLLAGER